MLPIFIFYRFTPTHACTYILKLLGCLGVGAHTLCHCNKFHSNSGEYGIYLTPFLQEHINCTIRESLLLDKMLNEDTRTDPETQHLCYHITWK
jgi:hypothetical protein